MLNNLDEQLNACMHVCMYASKRVGVIDKNGRGERDEPI